MTDIDVEQEIAELKDRVSRIESLLEGEPERADEVQTLADFIEEKNPSSHKERATVIGYYLEEFEGQDTFTVTDIEDGYRRARTSLPANMSDVLGDAEDEDWVMRVGDSGQTKVRQLTGDGISHVEDNLGTDDT